ncbi:MAG: TRAP transporter large permease subunit, partial [Myxococcales bacterium]|nr:TRAP transporter large permease subunit [Myxococcales bacterium]
MSTLYILALALCAICGAPLFIIIGGLAIVLFTAVGIDPQAVIIDMYRLASAPMLIAIPLFTFAGYLLAESKSPERMVNLYRALFGWIPGGLAVVSFVACAFFTAFTGASGVTIIALGGLLYPILISEKYSEKFSLGLLTTGGSLGLLFPPSLPLILFAIISQVNVDALFLAGIVPGIILVLLLSLFSTYVSIKQKTTRQKFELRKVFSSLRDAAWIVPLPFIVLVGIYG